MSVSGLRCRLVVVGNHLWLAFTPTDGVSSLALWSVHAAMAYPSGRTTGKMIPEPQSEEIEFSFEPDAVTMFVAESLNEAGFSPENSWLLACRHSDVDWHRAVAMLQKGWSEIDIVKVLV